MNYKLLPDTISSPDELPAMLMLEEQYQKAVYDDEAASSHGNPGHNPTIGYGFNLRDTVDLAFVLNQITVNGSNVFTQAASEGVTESSVVTAFENIVNGYLTVYPTLQSLQDALDAQLGSYWGLTASQSSGKFSLSQTQAQNVLTELIQGYSVGSYTVQPIYTQLSNYLADLGVSAANIPPDNSAEALALASLYYNSPSLIGPRLVAALNEDNSAQAWYQIRYQSDANDPNGGIEKRRLQWKWGQS